MPVPFILGAAAIGTGVYGVIKGNEASDNMDKAKRTNRDAKDMADAAERKIKTYKSDTNEALKKLGKTKISILSGSINDFVEQYSKIKNVDLKNSIGLEELKDFDPNSREFLEMKDMSYKASEIATGGIGAIAGGTLAGVGAGSLATTFGVASTGTAISALSGAAATNATLAWLGGGALSAGGFGMAGGVAVLGGIVVGPALAIGGAFMAAKAEKALNDARANYDKARKFKQEADNICEALFAIEKRSNQIREVLEKLDTYLATSVSKLKTVLEIAGVDWHEYRDKEQKIVLQAASVAKTTKVILDTSILREDGSLDPRSQDKLDTGIKYLSTLS